MSRLLDSQQNTKYKVLDANKNMLLGPVDKIVAEQYAYKMLAEHNIQVSLVPVTNDGKDILFG